MTDKDFFTLLEDSKADTTQHSPEEPVVKINYPVELGKRFHKRYGASIQAINDKLFKAYQQDNYFEIPSLNVKITNDNFSEHNSDLKPPVLVAMGTERVSTKEYTLRLQIPRTIVEQVYNDERFFEKTFDNITNQAYSACVSKYGEPGVVVQYGVTFFDYVLPSGQVFVEDIDGNLELRFRGFFAGGK